MDKCGEKCEVYSRVTGYFRPVANWNKGKQEEFKERKTYRVGKAVAILAALLVLALAAGCTSTRSVTITYDKDGNIVSRTETSDSIVKSITDSTKGKTVVAWESGWAAYLSASTATEEDPSPHVKMFAGKTDKGVISALPNQQGWDGITSAILATHYGLEVTATGIKSAGGKEEKADGKQPPASGADVPQSAPEK